MTALPLVFDAPRRGKPPRHLADLTRNEARAAVAELGQPAFRADQLARHFYRGVTDPAQMTDLPAAVRDTLTEALLPGLLTPVRHLSADGGRPRTDWGCPSARSPSPPWGWCRRSGGSPRRTCTSPSR